jgi:hypothetical protein
MLLDHVQVTAPRGCEAEARELLGLTEVEKPAALRAAGGAWFGPLHVGVEEPFAPARTAHPALRVEAGELDALATRLAAAGAPVEWDESIPGVRRFFTFDPWGNRVELLA